MRAPFASNMLFFERRLCTGDRSMHYLNIRFYTYVAMQTKYFSLLVGLRSYFEGVCRYCFRTAIPLFRQTNIM